MQAAIDNLTELPLSGAPWPGVEPTLDVRRLVIRGFPFSLAYQVQAADIIVLAVAHQRRTPFYWLDRAREPVP